jgi:outer membrane protein OmpA-like peptidoglycan-associated protein
MKSLIVTITFYVLSQLALQAQSPTLEGQYALHGRIGYLLNFYSSSFSNLQNTVDCGVLEQGNSSSINGSLTGEYLLNDNMWLGLSVGYFDRSGEFTRNSSFPLRDSLSSTFVTVETENVLATTIDFVEIGTEMRYAFAHDIFGVSTLRGVGGIRLGFPIDPQLRQTEEVLRPSNAFFQVRNDDGELRRTGTRTLADEAILNVTNPALGISFGIESLMKAGDNLTFTQQLIFDYNISSVVKDVDWNVSGIRLDVGFRIETAKQKPAPPVIPPEPVQPPPIVEAPKKVPVPRDTSITLQQTIVSQLVRKKSLKTPLLTLPAIFFEENQTDVPPRYILQQDESTLTNISSELDAHYSTIPLITKRMLDAYRNSKGVKLTLIAQHVDSKRSKEIAEKRLANVTQLFIQNGVPSDNIIQMKQQVSNDSVAAMPDDIQQELNHVAIELEPSSYSPFVTAYSFQGSATAEIDFANQRALPVNTTTQWPDKPSAPSQLTNDSTITRAFTLPLESYQLDTTLRFSTIVTTQQLVEELRADSTINLSSMEIKEEIAMDFMKFQPSLLFNYKSAELTDESRQLLNTFIKFIPDDVQITVAGSADIVGTKERNVQLSQERAEVVAEFLRSRISPKTPIITTVATSQFDNSLPEGRILNRSVRISFLR